MTTTPVNPDEVDDAVGLAPEFDDDFDDDADELFVSAHDRIMGRSRVEKVLPWLLTVGGVVGMAASFALTADKLRLLQDSTYVPACSINAVVSCTAVMKSDEASLFGFPNSLIGIASYAIVITLGVLLLTGHVIAPWVRRGLLAGAWLGVVFCHWLAFTTLYRIGALCPYCMVVWAVTIPMAWTLLVSEVRRTALARGKSGALAQFIVAHPLLPIVLWFAVMGSLIFVRFMDFWLGR